MPKWTEAQLNGKTVQFIGVKTNKGTIETGTGRFRARQLPTKLQIHIESQLPSPENETVAYFLYLLSDDQVELIQPHPNPQQWDFLLQNNQPDTSLSSSNR